MSIYILLTLTDNHAAAVAVQATLHPVGLRCGSDTAFSTPFILISVNSNPYATAPEEIAIFNGIGCLPSSDSPSSPVIHPSLLVARRRTKALRHDKTSGMRTNCPLTVRLTTWLLRHHDERFCIHEMGKIKPSARVATAAARMVAEPHDALAVVDDKQDVVGLFTQDDMIERGLKVPREHLTVPGHG